MYYDNYEKIDVSKDANVNYLFTMVVMISIDINHITILNICSVDYCCIIIGITKSEAIHLLRNAEKKLGKKGQNWIIIYNIFYHIWKMDNDIIYIWCLYPSYFIYMTFPCYLIYKKLGNIRKISKLYRIIA